MRESAQGREGKAWSEEVVSARRAKGDGEERESGVAEANSGVVTEQRREGWRGSESQQ